MLSKVLNGQSKSITGAAIIISGATLVSRIVGLVRDRIFAHYFGAGQVMDAYYAAFKIPDLIYNLLIIGALSAAFIPTFTKLFTAGEDKTSAWKLANNVLNITGISLLIVSILGIIFSPYISPLIAPGFSAEGKDLVVTFTRIMFLSPIFLGTSMVVGGILQSLRSFVLYSIAPIFYNLGIIIGVTLLRPFFGISSLAWGVVLGAIMHFSIQAYSAHVNGFRWQWYFNLKDKETRLISKLMIPRTLGLAVSQLNLVIVTVLASLLPAGSVAVFNYANNLQGVPVGIIGIPFALAVFPILSAASAQNNKEDFLKNLSNTSRQIIFLIIPVSIIIMLLRAQIVRTILGSGAFDWSATVNTADALALFSLGLFAQSLIPLFARAFYALSDTKTPFVIGIISEIIGIACALVLMKPLGVAGLALAFSVGGILNFFMLAIFLRKQTGCIFEANAMNSIFKMIIASILMGLAIQGLKYPLATIFDQHYFWGIFGQGLVAGVAGLLIYALFCYILRVPELIQIKESLTKRWVQSKNVTTTESISNNE